MISGTILFHFVANVQILWNYVYLHASLSTSRKSEAVSEVEIEISRELPTRAIWEILLSSHESSREIAISTSDTSFELRDVWKYFVERCVAKGATHNPMFSASSLPHTTLCLYLTNKVDDTHL